ncbi:MAG: class I SAM-dependent methyltransferase [Polyangiaceae bacterium]|nr:class I SAM-dependent methyltransferase [Polyangiaceae bacterium]
MSRGWTARSSFHVKTVTKMRLTYEEIYRDHAAQYDRLVRAEDHQGQLPATLNALVSLRDTDVIEVGAGTGRVTRHLVSAGARVVATEAAEAMLKLGSERVPEASWFLADARTLPVEDASADVGVAGWVFGHLRHWEPDSWRAEIGRGLDELARVVRPGGTLIVVETLGTGHRAPKPPNADLAEYYAWLENERGFVCQPIRTDYRFDSPASARELVEFFFGESKAELVEDALLPECTGVWSRRR